MKRFDAFLMIHKGLRAMMYDVSLSVQHTDFANAIEFPHSLERLALLLDIFDAHAGHEDQFLFCLLEACNPALQEEMEKEHVTDHALSAELRSLISAYRSAADPAEKRSLGSEIGYTLNEFIAFNLSHLNKEEIVVNESLWKHYSDQHIIEANMRLISSLSPEEIKRNAIWMLRACNDPELTGWLNVVKTQTPPPVFQLMLSLAEQELPAHRFESIRNRVMEVV